MITESISTFIQAANAVLLDIGERPITNFGSNLGLKVKSALVTATYEVGGLEDWNFLQTTKNADAWEDNRAILNNRRRLYRVLHRPSLEDRFFEVKYILPEVFERLRIVSGNVPFHCTTDRELSVLVNPYPTTNDERVKYWFVTAEVLTPPALPTDKFACPERFLELIKKRALYLMALRHLDDSAMASMFNSEYEVMAQRLRDTERSNPIGTLNLYRRR